MLWENDLACGRTFRYARLRIFHYFDGGVAWPLSGLSDGSCVSGWHGVAGEDDAGNAITGVVELLRCSG